MEGSSDAQTQTVTVAPDDGRSDLRVTSSFVGRTLGRYLVIESIGSGGMGVVLRGYDPRLEREVAIKLLRAGWLRDETRTQVIREARSMAKLNHPNVVAAFDVLGDEDVGLVMEYVPGRDLRRWLTDDAPAWGDVLRAFLDAGRGLAAAHQHGLLHRDFKPANVLLDRQGRARVTDFGLATSVTGPAFEGDAELGEEDASIDSGAVVGTPRYMSPEQHLGKALSPASDQYAFCVAVWEALTGEPPFRGDLRRSKLQGPPPWPGPRHVPKRIGTLLRRGLAVDPSERWSSMDALLDGLARGGERRWARWMVGAGGIAFAAATWTAAAGDTSSRCTGAVEQLGSAWDDQRRADVRAAMAAVDGKSAVAVWEHAAHELDEYRERWTETFDEACEATAIRGEQTTDVMDAKMACLRRARVKLDATTQVLADADAPVVHRAHELLRELPLVQRCADLQSVPDDVTPAPPTEREPLERVEELLAAATALEVAGRLDDSDHKISLAHRELQDLTYEPARTPLLIRRGHNLNARGNYSAAASSFADAYRLAIEWGQWEEAVDAATRLAFIQGVELAEWGQAEVHLRMAEGVASRSGNEDLEAMLDTTRGSVLWTKGDHAAAEAVLRNAVVRETARLGPSHPKLARVRLSLSGALYNMGRYEEMEAECRVALDILERHYGADHPQTIMHQSNLALALDVQGRNAEAVELYRRVLEAWIDMVGPDHAEVAYLRNNIAVSLKLQGRFDQAEVEYREALRVWRSELGADHPHVGGVLNNLGHMLLEQGEFERAEPLLRSALAHRQAALGPDHPEVARTHYVLGKLFMETDRVDQALVSLGRAWELLEAHSVPDGQRAAVAFVLATALRRAGDARGARRLARIALHASSRAEPQGEDSDEHRAEILAFLEAG